TKGAAVVVGGEGVGVRARSAASDSTILCMQTLRFLVGWGEPWDGTGGKSVHRVEQPLFAASTMTAGCFEAGAGEAPICLHGLRARPSSDDSGAVAAAAAATVAGGNPTGPSTVCFVCPLEDRARRCEFVQVTRQAATAGAANDGAVSTTNVGTTGGRSAVSARHHKTASRNPRAPPTAAAAPLQRAPDAALRQAVGRACEELLANTFSSSFIPIVTAAPPASEADHAGPPPSAPPPPGDGGGGHATGTGRGVPGSGGIDAMD
ncbi:unnamed protein product, partial [Ectocarpus sp. 12 AP-2014]